MKSIYRSEKAKEAVMKLYDQQLTELELAYHDLWINTSYGKTHLIETGNLSGKPLLVFHGGNATTAYNLKFCKFLLNDFHIFAIDTIGHPGKSAEVCLSPNNYDYGKWTSEVITGLGLEKIACFGGSFGAGVLVKTMCVAPEKVERAVLLVPSGIKNAPAYKSMNMMAPMIMYWITHKREWFIKCLLPMSVSEDNITEDILITARCSIDNARIKTGMPSNARTIDLIKYKAPIYVLAAEKDCLFPGEGVIKRAKKVWKNCDTYLLKGRGHINNLSDDEKEKITRFLY